MATKTTRGASLAVQQANAILKTSKVLVKAKRSGHRKKRKFTIPLAIVGGFVPFTVWSYRTLRYGGSSGFSTWAKYAPYRFIPIFEGKLNFTKLGEGLLPVLLGFAVHRFIGGKLGVNRMLSQAGIPVIRL